MSHCAFMREGGGQCYKSHITGSDPGFKLKKMLKRTHICICTDFCFPISEETCQSPSHYRCIVTWHNLKRKVLIKSIALYWSNAYFCDELFTLHSLSEIDPRDTPQRERKGGGCGGEGRQSKTEKLFESVLTLSYASLWNSK